MTTFKRCISLLLALSILLGFFAPAAQAAPMVESPAVNTDAMTIEGANGFGNLLAQELTEKQQEKETATENHPEGYCVSDLEIADDTATVAYCSLEEATLVVALYTEDRKQLLTSATTVVTPDASEAVVTFDGEMPEYFYASAYLLDQYDYSPLCAAYNTPMYTQEMRELLASTVDDYDPDRVWNLDDDKTTNFAVYAEDTIVIDSAEGVNTVSHVDDENRIYVIDNADEQITRLSPGDVFVYTYAEQEVLIIKVGEINAVGNTVTIIGVDVAMNEVFEAVKVENESNTENFVVDDSTADELIRYVGLVEKDESDAGTLATEDGFDGVVKQHKFSVGDKDETVEGSLSVELKVSAYYYLSAEWDYIKFKITQTSEISLTFRESILDKEKTHSLGIWTHRIAGFLVVVAFEPELKLEVGGEYIFTRSITSSFGFIYEKGEEGVDFTPIYDPPVPEDKVEAEFNIHIGIDLGPSFLILDDDIFKVKLNLLIGLDFTYTILELSTNALDENADEKHACISCSTIELKFTVELSVEVKVFSVNIPMDSLPTSGLYENEWILGRWYTSAHGTGEGICPNRTYRITMEVRDQNGMLLPNQDITISALDAPVTTDQNGIAVCYLRAGKTEFFTYADGFCDTESREIEGAQKVLLCLDRPIADISDESDFIRDLIEDELPEYVDRGVPMYEETFGESLTWSIYSDGTLVIDGKGEIPNYFTCFETPWSDYRKFISMVIIKDGITAIGDCAFDECINLGKAIIPNSVTVIGARAFALCRSLASVKIGSSITTIGNSAFEDCSSLTAIELPDTVTAIGDYAFTNCSNLTSAELGNSVTSIGDHAFEGCAKLASVKIPNSVTVIGNYVFSGCSSLTSVDFGSDITSIGIYAFSGCTKLTAIELPDSVTAIGDHAFSRCNSMISADIGSSITSIGDASFSRCSSLSIIELPNSITTIGDSAFFGCSSLSSINIPDRITVIASDVFRACTNLNNVEIGNAVTTIGYEAFAYCRSLASIELPEGVITIGDYAFIGCSSLDSIELPKNITTIGEMAFSKCTSLTRILVDENNPYYCTGPNGSVFNKTETDLLLVPAGLKGEYTVPSNVVNIGDYAFSGCDNLSSIKVPDSVTHIGRETFRDCDGLVNVELPNSITIISEGMFSDCYNLTNVVLPDSITTIDDGAFSSCSSLSNIKIPDSVTSIGDYAFSYSGLTAVEIGGGITSIGIEAFAYSTKLHDIIFRGDAPVIDYDAFFCVSANIYYPADNTTWTSSVKRDYGGWIHWVPYTLDEGGNMITGIEYSVPEISGNTTKDTVSPNAVYPGDCNTEITEEYTLKTASFTDLVPDQQYVILVLADIEVQNLLAPSNLLFIAQGVAQEDGTLSIIYVQRENTDISYVVACGASGRNLQNAVITFPQMCHNGELQVVDPTVVYDSKILNEGRDYVITGTVSYKEEGTYTCTIRGINNYTGSVDCVYTVSDHSHSFTNYISDGNAGCTEDGTKTAKCDYCDATNTIPDVGSALGHAYGAWTIIQSPTATEEGLEKHTCTRCGHTEQRSIAKLKNPFTDVPEGSFYYEPVLWAVENGITSGATETTYNPNGTCLRAQVVTFLHRADGNPEPTSTRNPFTDVKPGDFFYKPVLWAVEKGITSGVSATSFGSYSNCNRAAVVTFLWRAAGSPEPKSASNPFVDVKTTDFFYKPVLWAVENGITAGIDATHFGPTADCNRAQVVTFLYRAYN